MANEEHLRILRQGVKVWNQWREEDSTIPDLRGIDFRGANLPEADLSSAILSGADLSKANLFVAKLSEANLSGTNLFKANLLRTDLDGADLFGANLSGAKLYGTHLSRANLSGSKLNGADLSRANLFEADLSGADLTRTQLVETKIAGAVLTNCKIYGISAWRLEGIPKDQSNLIITRHDEPVVTVDNLEVAQFIYLLLHSEKIRYAIDTIAKKAVLILGRFTPERMALVIG